MEIILAIVLGAAAAAAVVTSTTMLRLSSFQSVLDAKPNEPPVCTRTLSLKTARRRNGDIDSGPNAFQNLALEAQNSRIHVKSPTYSLHCSSFLGLPFRILNIDLVKPKKGATMETIGNKGPRFLNQVAALPMVPVMQRSQELGPG